jgi:ABC-2 type transport system permease protein
MSGIPVSAGSPARPASRSMALALAAYELRLVLRRGEGLLITFVIPAGVLMVFSSFDTSGGDGDRSTGCRPEASACVIAAAMVSLAISTGFERQHGVIKRLGGSPGIRVWWRPRPPR